MKMPKELEQGTRTFGESIERLLFRVKGTSGALLRGGALAGALILSAPACDDGATSAACPDGTTDPSGYAAGKADWVGDQGQRNTDMVKYEGTYWHTYKECGNRGGCQGIDVFVKVLVKPQATANLDAKRVGVVFKATNYQGSFDATTTGTYFATRDDGWEEWHVLISRRSWEPGWFTFTAWYQDGSGATYYDDNAGERHVAAYQGIYTVLRQDWQHTGLTVGADGVKGTVSAVIADIDFDKDLRLVWTTDNWATVNESKIGGIDQPNAWYWVEDVWTGSERWEIDVDVPGPVDEFQYAIVYKHGVVNSARTYDFWDNNGGGNYVVKRPTVTE